MENGMEWNECHECHGTYLSTYLLHLDEHSVALGLLGFAPNLLSSILSHHQAGSFRLFRPLALVARYDRPLRLCGSSMPPRSTVPSNLNLHR